MACSRQWLVQQTTISNICFLFVYSSSYLTNGQCARWKGGRNFGVMRIHTNAVDTELIFILGLRYPSLVAMALVDCQSLVANESLPTGILCVDSTSFQANSNMSSLDNRTSLVRYETANRLVYQYARLPKNSLHSCVEASAEYSWYYETLIFAVRVDKIWSCMLEGRWGAIRKYTFIETTHCINP